MKNSITILSAKIYKQVAEINGKKYEFDFNGYDLAKSIESNNTCDVLSDLTGLSYNDYTLFEISDELSLSWRYEDVEQLISDFITENPNNLIDHLISE